MAANRYSAIIDIAVSGKSSREVAEILRKTEDIRDVLQSISKTPVALDDGRRANDVYKQLAKSVNDFARGIANGKRQLANTEVGLSKQVSALSRVAAQSKIGGALYKNAIESQVKAEQKLRLAQLARIDTESRLFARGKTSFNESFKGVPELIALGGKVQNTSAALEVYRGELERTLSVVDIGSNEFRALEEAIAGVEQRLGSARLDGQTSKISPKAGPATDLGTVQAFKQREKFEKSVEQQLTRQLAVEKRINEANLDDVQKTKLRNDLGEATNQLAANELTLSRQITTEVERQRMSLERAARARKNKEGGVRRTGEISPLAAPKRLQNIQNSAVIVQEKLNTLAARGVDVSEAKSRVEQFILNTKDSSLTLDLKTLNLLDNELNALRQILKLENQVLSTKNAQNKTDKASAKDTNKSKSRGPNKFQRVAVGAAFPALFGGGPLSILGGGIGEFFGPLMGVVGSAIGGALESTAVKIAEFGSALNKPTENLDKLARAAGLAGTAAGNQISLSQFLGAPEVGGRIASNEVTALIGEGGTKGLKNLGTETTKLTNAFEQLKTRLGSFVAPLLTGLAKAGTFMLGGSSEQSVDERNQRISSIESQLEGPIRGRSAKGTRSRLEKELATLKKADKESIDANKDLNNIIKGRLAPLKAAADLEKARLGLTRDVLASQQGQVSILSIQKTLGELEIRRDQLEAGLERDKLQILIDQTKEQERQAKAARDNAVEMARIQIRRDVSAQTTREFQAMQDIADVRRSMEEITFSDADNFERKLLTTERQLEAQVALKLEQMEMNLLTIREPELRIQTMRAVAQEISLLQKKTVLLNEQIHQNEIMRQDAAQAIVNARELNKLQQALSTQRDINQMDPSRAFAAGGPGLGFFEQSVLLDANLLEDRTLQLDLYNAQIERLQERISSISSVDPELSLPLENDLKDLQAAKKAYEQLQPAIDAARVRQQQFNDAFAMVSPAVGSLINGLSEVVQGTKSAQEAFADFLRTIGDTLVQEGTRMIATYIAIGIAKAFAGLASGGASAGDAAVMGASPTQAAAMSSSTGVAWSTDMPLSGGIIGGGFDSPRMANGGPVEGGRPYMVGERGPEMFIPGSSGGIMRNEDMRQMMGRSPAGVGAPQMNFTFETTNIGGTEFVSREQLETAMATTRRQAASDGAKQGMSMTLDKMQNSPRTRSRVGIR